MLDKLKLTTAKHSLGFLLFLLIVEGTQHILIPLLVVWTGKTQLLVLVLIPTEILYPLYPLLLIKKGTNNNVESTTQH